MRSKTEQSREKGDLVIEYHQHSVHYYYLSVPLTACDITFHWIRSNFGHIHVCMIYFVIMCRVAHRKFHIHEYTFDELEIYY